MLVLVIMISLFGGVPIELSVFHRSLAVFRMVLLSIVYAMIFYYLFLFDKGML